MRKLMKRSAVAGAAVAAMVAGGVMTAVPAHANVPGTHVITASSLSECHTKLSKQISSAVRAGADITGVHSCNKRGSDYTWYASFVAHY